MLNCESNLYRVKSTGFGGFTITNLKTKETKTVATVPDTKTLAAAHEREFDRLIGEVFNKN